MKDRLKRDILIEGTNFERKQFNKILPGDKCNYSSSNPYDGFRWKNHEK